MRRSPTVPSRKVQHRSIIPELSCSSCCLAPTEPIRSPPHRPCPGETLDATCLINLSCPVTRLVSLPNQRLSSPPNLIQFFVIPFVKDILDFLFEVLFRHRNVMPVLYEPKFLQWPTYRVVGK